eukprot:snap_masked-scaffold_8-processed-gene-12.27-mRNA-1 protein AED:1.00 eAED:1.00 QI:0/-1/0/0/-1/1/1/0/239
MSMFNKFCSPAESRDIALSALEAFAAKNRIPFSRAQVVSIIIPSSTPYKNIRRNIPFDFCPSRFFQEYKLAKGPSSSMSSTVILTLFLFVFAFLFEILSLIFHLFFCLPVLYLSKLYDSSFLGFFPSKVDYISQNIIVFNNYLFVYFKPLPRITTCDNQGLFDRKFEENSMCEEITSLQMSHIAREQIYPLNEEPLWTVENGRTLGKDLTEVMFPSGRVYLTEGELKVLEATQNIFNIV